MFKPRHRKGLQWWSWGLVLLVTFGPVSSVWGEEGDEEDAAPVAPQVRYMELKPTFVTNFGIAEYGRLKYLKADVSVKLSSSDGESAVRYHLPALRNALVLLFSSQDESTVSSREGRDELRKEALVRLREILEREEGDPYIEDVLFTNFIVQG